MYACVLVPLSLHVYMLLAAIVFCIMCFDVHFHMFVLYLYAVVISLIAVAFVVFLYAANVAVRLCAVDKSINILFCFEEVVS